MRRVERKSAKGCWSGNLWALNASTVGSGGEASKKEEMQLNSKQVLQTILESIHAAILDATGLVFLQKLKMVNFVSADKLVACKCLVAMIVAIGTI